MQANAETITLKSGLTMPRLGFGTWRLAESRSTWADEIAVLRHALDLGFRHIDTAEMYGDGDTEKLIGEALRGYDRESLFITSKFYPHHAEPVDMHRACERSLRALGTDYLDLYLLHWPGAVPIERTLHGAAELLQSGKIKTFGISNFNTAEFASVMGEELSGMIDVNQVMYNPARRGIEFDLLPLMGMHNVACVAYTPIEPRLMRANKPFAALAAEAGLSPAALALSWHMALGHALPIPKASTKAHVEALAAASTHGLSEAQRARIDAAFPPPRAPVPLDII